MYVDLKMQRINLISAKLIEPIVAYKSAI
jgi:hypothetical protein